MADREERSLVSGVFLVKSRSIAFGLPTRFLESILSGGNFCAGYDLEELSSLEENLANKIAEILMDQGPMVRR